MSSISKDNKARVRNDLMKYVYVKCFQRVIYTKWKVRCKPLRNIT